LDEEFAKTQWQTMRSHPVGRVLLGKGQFKAALALFEKAQKKRVVANPLQNERLTAYNARLLFIQVVASYANSAATGEWRKRLNAAEKEQIRKALKSAKRLQEIMKEGVQMSDVHTNETLVNLLKRFKWEMNLRNKSRAARKDKDSGRRKLLHDFAYAILDSCGWCSATGLLLLAEAINVPCDEKYAQRICKGTEKSWGMSFAALLNNPVDR
jgi:hypothetical protein